MGRPRVGATRGGNTAPMRARRGQILALVLAGGEGGRLDVLTAERAKPALPFAGVYRLIDFPLSNCHHSRVSDVWVLQQYEPHGLTDHLSNGRPWDLDRTYGGLRVVHPYLGDEESGWYRGNADAIQSNREAIEEFDPELVLVLSADAVYRLDYRDVVEGHREAGAEATLVTTEVAQEEAGRFGVVEVDADGRVAGFAYKPDDPPATTVTTEVFVYDTSTLLDLLGELAGGDGEVQDFGHELLPALVERGRVRAHPLDGYWRDVGTVESYWQAHQDLLGSPPVFDLDSRTWPILTLAPTRPPARIAASARIDDSRIGAGADVRGEVVRSVLGPGVVVEEGATVRDCVLLADAVVREHATLERAVLDERVEVGAEARVGGRSGEIVAAGMDAIVEPGSEVPPGARLDPRGR